MVENVTNPDEREKATKTPDGFDDQAEFLQWTKAEYKASVEYDRDNREEARIDHQFVAGEQWDQAVYRRRINANKPALTINRLLAFVSQVIGARLQNVTEIKIRPSNGGTKDIARVREGMVRAIQRAAIAKRAYKIAYQNQVIGGLGNFQVRTEYASNDVFEQDIVIDGVYDDQAVIWDRQLTDPTGADARYVFVAESIDRDTFNDRYPDKNPVNFNTDDLDYTGQGVQQAEPEDTVRIVDFWRVRSRRRTLALMQDGGVQDVTDLEIEDWIEKAYIGQDAQPYVRESDVKYVEMFKLSGADVLEGPYELSLIHI